MGPGSRRGAQSVPCYNTSFETFRLGCRQKVREEGGTQWDQIKQRSRGTQKDWPGCKEARMLKRKPGAVVCTLAWPYITSVGRMNKGTSGIFSLWSCLRVDAGGVYNTYRSF